MTYTCSCPAEAFSTKLSRSGRQFSPRRRFRLLRPGRLRPTRPGMPAKNAGIRRAGSCAGRATGRVLAEARQHGKQRPPSRGECEYSRDLGKRTTDGRTSSRP
jgi:hypothetical protein